MLDARQFYKKYKGTISSLNEYAHNIYFTATTLEVYTAYECIRTVIRNMAHDIADSINREPYTNLDDALNDFDSIMDAIMKMLYKDMRTEVYAGVFDGWWLSNDWKSILREVPRDSKDSE